jgi:DNA-binding NarL/FixJ family response regulator
VLRLDYGDDVLRWMVEGHGRQGSEANMRDGVGGAGLRVGDGGACGLEGPITVVCASFGAIFDAGLTGLLGEQQDLEVVGDRLALSELEARVASCSPQVAVLEGRQVSDLRVLRRLRMMQPGIALVVLVYGLSEPYSRQLLACGASACLSWDAEPEELVAAIRLAVTGKGMLVPSSRPKPEASVTLTPRQQEVLRLVQGGLPNGEIASMLQISENTVRAHLKHIFLKLEVKRRRDLVAIGSLSLRS